MNTRTRIEKLERSSRAAAQEAESETALGEHYKAVILERFLRLSEAEQIEFNEKLERCLNERKRTLEQD